MKHLFVPHNISVALKENGFSEPCFAFYESDGTFKFSNGTLDFDGYWSCKNKGIDYCAAPLWQQVIDWFREKHNFVITIVFSLDDCVYKYKIDSNISRDLDPYHHGGSNTYVQYYPALTECITEALEIIK